MKFKGLVTGVVVLGAMVFGATSSFAEIKEIRSMEEVLPYMNDQTLLVFDLDNTVIEPVQSLGSDQWFHDLLNQGNPVDQAVATWSEVQPVTRVKAVEAFTPSFIAAEQLSGLKVMALTARPSTLAQATERQLRSVGVNFLGSPVYGDDVTNINGLGDEGPKYIRGIEFVSPKLSKGEALVQFLHQIGFKPQRIVFVDDTAKHTVTVNDSLNVEGIQHFEFRYGATDAKVAAYDSKIAAIEFQIFQKCGKLVSDNRAAQLEKQNIDPASVCR